MAVHTMDGCVVERSDYYKDSSVLETDNCYINAPGQGDNQGCAFNDHAPNNFGKPFNEIGGGVYATEWTSDVVNVWFFSRGDIPEDLNGPSPDPTAWGKPNAQFKGTCDFTKLLKEQRFVSFFFPLCCTLQSTPLTGLLDLQHGALRWLDRVPVGHRPGVLQKGPDLQGVCQGQPRGL